MTKYVPKGVEVDFHVVTCYSFKASLTMAPESHSLRGASLHDLHVADEDKDASFSHLAEECRR
jgi:hypothetical protein